MEMTPGHLIGPFEIIRPLGQGGMGAVYLAYDTRLERRVALKILHDRAPGAAARHLQREARATARLTHPNIAALYDIIEHGDAVVMVMEFVEGESLAATVARGALDVASTLDIGVALTDALAYAHREGIVHADVKPANVGLTHDGKIKLLDLGIARIASTDPVSPTRTSNDSANDSGKGTPAYMAPEQLAGHPADARSDVYSTGLVLYELLTGRQAYRAPDFMALAMALASATAPPRVSRTRPEIPAVIDDIVARAMARDPAARYQSAAELRDALDAVRMALRAGDTLPRATVVPEAAARRRLAVVGGLLVFASFIVVLVTRPWDGAIARPVAPIAVLPAINLSGDATTGELGAGLVAILTDNLSSAPGVTVAAHAAVATYRNADRDLSAVAHELGAAYVVNLAIGGEGAHLRVNAQIVSADSPAPLWSDTIEGDAAAIQRDVIDRVASALEAHGLFPRASRARARRLPTSDAQALLEYARGVALLDAAANVSSAEAAIAAFDRAVARDPAFALALAGQAQAYSSMYSFSSDAQWVTRAADAARRALAIDPAQSGVHVSLARVYRTQGQLEDAERHARLATSLSPQNDDAHRVLGLVLTERGSVEAGVAEIRAAIALRPDYWTHYDTLGYVFYRAARYEDAIAPYRRVVELRPNFAGGYQTLGTVLHYTGRVDEANGNYEHALRLGPEPAAYSNLAFGYYSVGRFADALTNYEQAIRLNPASPVSYRNRGETYRRLRQDGQARRDFEEAIARAKAPLDVNPNDARLIALVAVCEAKLGRVAAARKHASEAVALKQTDSDVVFKLAVVQALTRDEPAALRTLARAIELGYPRAFARGDWDFEAMWSRDDFKRLTDLPPAGGPGRQ